MLVQVDYATSCQSVLVINEQMSKDIIEGGGTYATFVLPKDLLQRLIHQPIERFDLYKVLHAAFQLLVYPDENCQQVFPGKDLEAFLQRDHLTH